MPIWTWRTVPLERWGSEGADFPVAAGVLGEILFHRRGGTCQDELTRRSNSEASEANEKAEEAQLARFRLEVQLAPRALTKDHYDALQALRGKIDKCTITSIRAA